MLNIIVAQQTDSGRHSALNNSLTLSSRVYTGRLLQGRQTA